MSSLPYPLDEEGHLRLPNPGSQSNPQESQIYPNLNQANPTYPGHPNPYQASAQSQNPSFPPNPMAYPPPSNVQNLPYPSGTNPSNLPYTPESLMSPAQVSSQYPYPPSIPSNPTYPPQPNANYTSFSSAYPPNNASYSPSNVLPANPAYPPPSNTPYPPSNSPYPPSNSPYPPASASYPPVNAPYPPSNAYYPAIPTSMPHTAQTPPSNASAQYPSSHNPTYPPPPNDFAVPTPPNNSLPYPSESNNPYPLFDQTLGVPEASRGVSSYPSQGTFGGFSENQNSAENKGGLLSDMKNLAMKSPESLLDAGKIKQLAKDKMKAMFEERSSLTPRASHIWRMDQEASDGSPQESPKMAPKMEPPQTRPTKFEIGKTQEMQIKAFRGQEFKKLRSQARQSQDGLFKDDLFRAESIQLTSEAGGTSFSIYGNRRGYRPSEIKWLRPKEICRNPKMFVDGTERFDINQGEIGDCWFLASLANLAESKDCFKRVVPDNQDFGHNYAGIFRFRFYRFGEWVEVVIDDKLPTRNGKLIYLKSTKEDEFWSPLLEKAYAKLYGSYKVLEGGLTIEASVDFTGGIPEMIDISRVQKKDYQYLFDYMKKADANGAFMSCSLSNSYYQRDAVNKGLQTRHAYTITKIVDVRSRGVQESIPLIRLRNPHGNSKEWTGDWSDQSRQWRMIDDRTRRALDLRIDGDGEFYMNFNIDFLKYFGEVELVHLTPGHVGDIKGEDNNNHREFNMFHFQGRWSRILGTAGGCGNDSIASFAENPQFIFSIRDPGNKPYKQECPVIVSLAQKVEKRKSEMAIGFKIYKIAPGVEKVDKQFLMYNRHVAKTEQFINLREISLRSNLPEGEYVVIPSTFARGDEGHFLLRLYFDKKWGASSPSSPGGSAQPIDRPLPAGPEPRHDQGPRPPRREPFVRGFGGRASRVINIPIQILSDANDQNKRRGLRGKILEQLMKNKTFRTFREKLEFLYKWRPDHDSEISLLQQILNSLKAQENI